jgi:hypothetical protein
MLNKPRKRWTSYRPRKQDRGIDDQWKRYLKRLPKKGGDFGLDYDEFKSFVTQPCFYCGSLGTPKRKGGSDPAISNGIDRLDNRRGYYIDNIVPCCKLCNQAKKEMGVPDFLEHSRKIAVFQISKDENWLREKDSP